MRSGRRLTAVALAAAVCAGCGSTGDTSKTPSTPAPLVFKLQQQDAPISLTNVVAADLNGDGVPDLAAVIIDTMSISSGVAVYRGRGDGTFDPYSRLGTEFEPRAVVVADFDSDGKPDLAAVGIDSNDLAVWLGNGDGTFRRGIGHTENGLETTSYRSLNLLARDLDGDGRMDLLLDGGTLLGNGDGTFRPTWQRTLDRGIRSDTPALGDVDGDGRVDLVTTVDFSDYATQARIAVQLGNGDGSFRSPQFYEAGSAAGRGLALGDFDRDGHLDAAVSTTDDRISLLFGNGDGTFRLSATRIDAGREQHGLASADVDGDGILDLAEGNVQSITFLLGRGDGTFRIQDVTLGDHTSLWGFVLADLNRDHRLDLAVTSLPDRLLTGIQQ